MERNMRSGNMEKNCCEDKFVDLGDPRIPVDNEEGVSVHVKYVLRNLCPGRIVVVRTVYEVWVCKRCFKFVKFFTTKVEGEPCSECRDICVFNDLLVPVTNPCTAKINVKIKDVDFDYIHSCSSC